MLPEQLLTVRKKMRETNRDMWNTIVYYAERTEPLRGHKDQDSKLVQTYEMNSNMTTLSNLID